jgi:hypothetical protein
MSVKEITTRYALTQLLPLLGGMSDGNLLRFISAAKKLAPNDYSRNVMNALTELTAQQHPTVELVRRVLRMPNAKVKERLLNNLLIKQYWQGSVRREQLLCQGRAAPEVMLISPTMRCNLRCPGCYAANYDFKTDLECEVIDRVLDEGEFSEKTYGLYMKSTVIPIS